MYRMLNRNELWDDASFFFQAEDGIRDLVRSRGLGDVYKRQPRTRFPTANLHSDHYGCVRFSPDGRLLAVGEVQPLSLIHI